MLGAAGASGFFAFMLALAPLLPRLEFTPEGGGDFILGDRGHWGVESAEAAALLGARGSLETASAVAPGCCSCGTLEVDKARCIAAALGWVDSVLDNAGALSFRRGEVFLDVRGLCPVAGEDAAGASDDEDFFNVDEDDAPEDEGDLFVPAFDPFVALLPVGSAVSACPLIELKLPSLLVMMCVVCRWF